MEVLLSKHAAEKLERLSTKAEDREKILDEISSLNEDKFPLIKALLKNDKAIAKSNNDQKVFIRKFGEFRIAYTFVDEMDKRKIIIISIYAKGEDESEI